MESKPHLGVVLGRSHGGFFIWEEFEKIGG